MSSKVAAAKIAAWSGVRTVIAAADRDGVLADAVAGVAGVGTTVAPHDRKLTARKLWIAFAVGSSGTLVVDPGARAALERGGVSLLPAGVVATEGTFDVDDAVEIADPDGTVFAKGLVRAPVAVVDQVAGRRSADLPDGVPRYLVHADDLVVLP